MKKHIVWIIVLAMIPAMSWAGIFAKTGTAGLQFLKLSVDARAIGMGEAYTPVSDDISSVYWNPGGLALKDQDQLFFSHTNWVADIYQEYFAVSRITDFGTFAFSATMLHMDDMDITDEENFGPTGETFTCSDMALGITYSQKFTDKFSFGITAKYLREDLYEYSVNGMSIDLGTQYNTLWNNLTVGMALRNFGPDLEYDLDNDDDGRFDEDPMDQLDNDGDGVIDEDRDEMAFQIPMSFSFGLSGDVFRNEDMHLIGSFQIDNCVDREETFSLGAEYRFLSMFVRSGYMIGYDEASFTFGLGWVVNTSLAVMNIDWAYTSMGNLEEDFLNSAHRLSLKMMY